MMSRRQVGLEWFIARVFFFYGVPKVFLRVIVARLEPTLVTRNHTRAVAAAAAPISYYFGVSSCMVSW
jgi:hypothetical protein